MAKARGLNPEAEKVQSEKCIPVLLTDSTENREEHFLAHDLALALTQRAMNHPKIYFDHEKLIAYRLEIKSKSMIKIKKGPGGRGRIAMAAHHIRTSRATTPWRPRRPVQAQNRTFSGVP
jgi:hypothetical protein